MENELNNIRLTITDLKEIREKFGKQASWIDEKRLWNILNDLKNRWQIEILQEAEHFQAKFLIKEIKNELKDFKLTADNIAAISKDLD